MVNLKQITCPVCRSKNEQQIFSKKSMPLYNLELHYDRESALKAKKGELNYYLCRDCGFVFNAAFDSSLMDYKIKYNNYISSEIYKKYMDTVVDNLNEVFDLNGKTIVEVGCGNGEFLKKLRQKYSFKGYGYDPNLCKVNNNDSDLTFIQDYYNASLATPDLILLRHTLEHISDPHAFLESITGNQELDIYIEVPSWDWIVNRKQIFAFSYEHCSYYSQQSLEKTLGFHNFITKKIIFGFEEEHLEYYGTKKNKK